MSLKNLLFVTFFVGVSLQVFSQRIREEYSYMGIHGGYTLFNINTDNFTTEQMGGFTAGFLTRGDWYNRFYMEYGVNFMQNQVGILGRDPNAPANKEFIDHTLSGVQLRLQMGYHIIRHHLGIEFAPILNVNGKLKANSDTYNEYLVEGYNAVQIQDIADVSRVNFHLAGGITAGAKHFRAHFQYQYGVTNLLNRLNDEEVLADEKPSGGFKGNSSTIILGLYILF